MNRIVRGKSSRVHQAPIPIPMVPPSHRSIPLAIEVVKGRRRQDQLPREEVQRKPSPTKPIPIKKVRPSPQEREEEAESASLQYDFATWQMYERITNARRLRRLSRSEGQSSAIQQAASLVTQEQYFRSIASKQQVLDEDPTASDGQPPTTEDDCTDEGIFVLDDAS